MSPRKPDHKTDIALIKQDVEYIKNMINDLKDDHVKKEEFEPVKRVVYATVSTILLAFIGAVIALVIK